MKTRDLGTYHVRVTYAGGWGGHITRWDTCQRFGEGSGNDHPLSALLISPTWDSEEDLLETILYMYLEGNYACDCNKRLSLARARQDLALEERFGEDPESNPCGHAIPILRIEFMRPNETLWNELWAEKP